MELINHTVIYNLIIFVLAVYVGYHVVWNVTPALHTPLMAVTNAISAIVIVGAMLAAALTVTPLGKAMGTLAVALAAVNVFGGFLVTRRMLEMFKKKEPKAGGDEHEPGHPPVPHRLGLLHPGAQGPVAPDHLAPRQPVRHGRHGHRGPHHRRPDLQAGRRARRQPAARPGPGARRAAGRRRGGRLRGQARRDDQDARAGRLHAQHDRPGGGVHRHRRGGRAGSLRPGAAGRGRGQLHPLRQPPGAVPRRGHRRHHLLRFGDRLRQAVGQVQVPPVPGRPGGVRRPAPAQPGAGARHARLRHPVLPDAILAALHRDAGAGLRARRADHHPDRRRRHAGGGVDAQLLLRLGRGGYRLLAEQLDADHRRLAGRLLGRDPLLHHVQGDEPLVLQRHPRRLRRRSRRRPRRAARRSSGR